jgi:hypothetical protein
LHAVLEYDLEVRFGSAVLAAYQPLDPEASPLGLPHRGPPQRPSHVLRTVDSGQIVPVTVELSELGNPDWTDEDGVQGWKLR